MAIIKEMPSLKIIDGFKGVIDFYYYMGIPCCRAWPKSPGHSRSEAVMRQWPIFSNANKIWHTISPSVRESYQEMAVTTDLTSKDMFVRGYISGILRYYTAPDSLE